MSITVTENVTVTYTITPTNGLCDGIPFNYEVIVTPLMQSNATVTNVTCFDTNDGTITTSVSGGIPPYSVSWSGPAGFPGTTHKHNRPCRGCLHPYDVG